MWLLMWQGKRIVWEDFCQILREDEITASIQNEGLALSW